MFLFSSMCAVVCVCVSTCMLGEDSCCFGPRLRVCLSVSCGSALVMCSLTRYDPKEGRYAMVTEACARLAVHCSPLADIIRECCIPSPVARPSSSDILSRLESIDTSALSTPPSASAAESSFPSLDVITAMEALGFKDAAESIGDAVLSQAMISQSNLVTLLSSVGVSVSNKAALLRALTATSNPVSPCCALLDR